MKRTCFNGNTKEKETIITNQSLDSRAKSRDLLSMKLERSCGVLCMNLIYCAWVADMNKQQLHNTVKINVT